MINWSPLSRSPGSHRVIKCAKCLPPTTPDMTTRVTIIPWFPLCITLSLPAGHEICCAKLFPPQASAPEEFPTHSAPPWPRPALPMAIIKRTCALPRAASLGKEQSVSSVLEVIEQCGEQTGFILLPPRLTAPATVRAADLCQFIC